MTDVITRLCRDLLARHAETPLFVRPGTTEPPYTRRTGYLPLLVQYTHEDRAAKGLRSLRDPLSDRTPVHYSALEITVQEDAILLMGPPGSGKTSFVLDLALSLAGEIVGDPDFHLSRLQRSLPRNEAGQTAVESWTGPTAVPIYLSVDRSSTLEMLMDTQAPGSRMLVRQEQRPPVLIILDGLERAGELGPDLLASLVALQERYAAIRLIATGVSPLGLTWTLPARVHRYQIRPLLDAQKAAYRAAVGRPSVPPIAASRPELFVLGLGLNDPPTCESRLAEVWLEHAYSAAELEQQAERTFRQVNGDGDAPSTPIHGPALADTLVARHLETWEIPQVAALFGNAPQRWSAAVQVLARRRTERGESAAPLLLALIDPSAAAREWGALLAAEHLAAAPDDPAPWPVLGPLLVAALGSDSLPAEHRDTVGRHLSRHGDPRDLDELISLPGGAFVMGATLHATAQPVHRAHVGAFRIGRYPVTNRLYRRFIAASGRPWPSTDGGSAERGNAPAVDLSWHDARACCEWLTGQWRRDGRIAADERVRLPSEAEWEYAARGDRPDGGETIVYPWAGTWQPDHANSSEAGFNTTTCVGIFPAGRTPSGLDDMSGQIWEWTSTLWGDDMAVPTWRYPYGDDGREAADAPDHSRRVLRGGCFSSGREKACCTYRGSLEPPGFWRGNGFRVVVGKE